MATPDDLPPSVRKSIDDYIAEHAGECGSDSDGSVFDGPDIFDGTFVPPARAPPVRKNACTDPLRVRRQFSKSFATWAARARSIAVVPAPPATATPPEAPVDTSGCAKCTARETRRRQRVAPAAGPQAHWDERYLIAALAGAILDGATPKQLPTTAKGVDADLAARGAALAGWWREKYPVDRAASTTEA